MNVFTKQPRKHSQILHSSFISLVMFFCLAGAFWAAESFTAVQLPQHGQVPLLYANQNSDDLRSTYVAAINSAQKTVTLIIYSLTDTAVIKALREKSEEGIPVTVICDPNTSPYAKKQLGKLVNVCKRKGDGLMHQKILLIDGESSLIGSANMTSESLRMHGNLVTGIHSPVLAAVIQAKADCMQKIAAESPILHQDLVIGSQPVEFWLLPDDTQAIPRLLNLISTAEKTVRVAMFTWTRQDLAKAVIAAHNRGVDTQVVVDRNAGKGAGAKVVALLKANGISVKLSQGTALLHHKFMYIDGKTLVNGSANWTLAAFTKNDDCFLIIKDLNNQQQKQMNALWNIIDAESE